MAFPTVLARYGGDFGTTNLAAVDVPLTGTSTGEIVIIALGLDHGVSGRTGTWSDGFTELIDGSGVAEAGLHIAVKKLDGTETSPVTFTLDAGTERGGYMVWRIDSATVAGGLASAVQIGSRATGLSTSPDPPSFTPTGGAKDWLWIALMAADNGNTTVNAYPTSFTNGETQTGGTAGGAVLGTARRELNTATLDAAAFTISASEEWDSLVLAIEPAAGSPNANHNVPLQTATASKFTVTASGGANVAVPLKTSTSSVLGATASISTSIGVPLQSVSASVFPTTFSGGVSVAVPLLTSPASLFAVTVTTGSGDISYNVPLQTVSVASLATTVSGGADVTVPLQTAATTTLGVTPAGSATVTVPLMALGASAQAVAVSGAANHTVPLLALSAAVQAVTVFTGIPGYVNILVPRQELTVTLNNGQPMSMFLTRVGPGTMFTRERYRFPLG